MNRKGSMEVIAWSSGAYVQDQKYSEDWALRTSRNLTEQFDLDGFGFLRIGTKVKGLGEMF